MNNSNSFNICPRCGTANSLNAKYCYQCGSQLRVPEEPVRCPKCNTVNSSLANFCRTCGTVLKTASKTKICPRCGKEVPMEENVCSCGYSFANMGYANPTTLEQTKQTEVSAPAAAKAKGGRVVALFSLVFLAVFGYLFFAPQNWLPDFLRKSYTVSSNYYVNVFHFIYLFVQHIVTQGFSSEISPYVILVAAVTSATALCMAIHALSGIIRLIFGGRPKRPNTFYLIMALLTTLSCAAVMIPRYLDVQFLSFLDIFKQSFGSLILVEYIEIGIPVYFWFFWIFSFIARKKTAKK